MIRLLDLLDSGTTMKKIVGTVLTILFVSYVAYECRGLVFAPPLAVWSPSENLVTDERSILLEGKTTPGTQVSVNGSQVLPTLDGHFSLRVALQGGLNTLEVKAFKRYSRPRVIERTILVSRSGPKFSHNYKTGAEEFERYE